MDGNPFVPVSQRLQEFDGIKARPFPIDSLRLWRVRDVVLVLPLYLLVAGTIRTLWFSEQPGYITVWQWLQMAVLRREWPRSVR